MVVDKENVPRPVVNRYLGPDSLHAYRNEKAHSRSALWEHSAMLAYLRRLKREQFPFEPGFFRKEENARAWVSGIIAFKSEGLDLPSFQGYLGRMSNSSFTFTRTLPRDLLRQFVSLCVKGRVEYVNMFGSVRDRVTQSDPLLRMAIISHRGEVNPRNRSQTWLQSEERHHVIMMADDGRILPYVLPITVQGLGWSYDAVNGFDDELC